jgi:hypothetical protein
MATATLVQFAPCGLIFDASGVVLLGFSFFFKTTESMIQESGTTWDSEAYKTVAASKCDGIFGTVLLLLGFVFQAIGNVGFESKPAVVGSYGVLVVFLAAYFFFLRGWLISKWVGDIEAKLREKQS